MRNPLSWLSLSLVPALALLAGCPKPLPEPEPDPAPRILSFTATETELPEGGVVTLRWETEHASSSEIVDSGLGTVSGSDALSGELEVQVNRTTLFILTASGTRARTDTAVVQVRAGPGDTEILLVAQPSVIARGEPVTLAWAVTRTDGLRLTKSDGEEVDVGTPASTGSVTVFPEEDTTWVLHSHGRSATASARLRPDVTRFDATPKGAIRGQPVEIAWETTSATRVRLEDGEGGVLASTDVPAEVAAGSYTFPVGVSVDRDTVYNFRLFAEGSSAEAVSQRLLTVYIAGQSRVAEFDAARYVRAGEPFTVSWRTIEADRVQLLADGEVIYETLDAHSAEQGSTVLPAPASRIDLTLRATSLRGGHAELTRPVSPVGSTQVVTLGATPAAIAQGGSPVTLSWHILGARRVRVEHTVDGTVFSGGGDEMEQHSIVVYPNASGTYVIVADNTLGEEVRPSQAVTVAQPATWTLDLPGPVFSGQTVELSSPGGTAPTFVGFSHDEVDVESVDGFIDISQTATFSGITPPSDAFNTVVRLPFEFWMYGERVPGSFIVFADGVLVFQPFAKPKAVPAPIPNLNHEPQLVAPFWIDLEQFSDETTLSWEVRGEAPDQLLVVHWDQMRVKGFPTSRISFQAQIHQNGVIRFAYRDVELPAGVAPTIGVQGPVPGLGISHASVPEATQVLTFFGPRTQLELSPTRHGNFSGFVQMGDGQLRVGEPFDRYVAPNQLAITEALPEPHASLGAGGQWVEITNGSKVDVDLAGWTLEGPAGTWAIPAAGMSAVVPAGGVLVIGGSTTLADSGGAPVDLAWGGTLSLESGASSVSLKNPAGEVWADLVWGATVAGRSVVRDPAGFVHEGDGLQTPPRGLDCVGSKVFGEVTLGQLGTPGVRSGCFGYRMEPRPVSYRDISEDGTLLGTGVASASHVPMTQHLYGSPTVAFGAPVTSLGISRHGHVTFDAPVVVNSPFVAVTTVAPSASTPARTAAIFGRTLSWTPGLTGVYSKRMEAGDDPQNPNAHWIIQWHHVSSVTFLGHGEDLNFQLKLFDDGVLEYHYGALVGYNSSSVSASNWLVGLGADVVAWLENAGNVALPISVQRAGLRSHTAYRFIPE